ncbi:MAG: MarR family winged helix-turn-helix transcriptional regulator [Nocardioides sp.]|uniref:MarR family winged helix-turn-helix transcriptional regulator n=1 Tax=Nocardioides sp. TaxID=35761 RepID=UPI003F05A03C
MTDHRIGVDLFILNRALEAAAYEAVVANGADDVTLAQARLLARVDEEGTRVVELAGRALVTKQTASHLVDQLERAGYVERTVDPSDARARLVRLTPRARAVVPAANAAVVSLLEQWGVHVGAPRLAAVAETLAALAEVADPFRRGAGTSARPSA